MIKQIIIAVAIFLSCAFPFYGQENYSILDNIDVPTKLIRLVDECLNDFNNPLSKELSLIEDPLSVAIINKIKYEELANLNSNKIRRKLINFYPDGLKGHILQFACYHQNELVLIWNLYAKKVDDAYSLESSIYYNTASYHSTKVGKTIYHHINDINISRAKTFDKKNHEIAKQFNLPAQSFDFYMVRDYQELQKLIGIDYSKKQIGQTRDGWGVIKDQFIFSVMNNEDFSHDIFHYYSGTVHERPTRNWVTEEGLAYLWGNAYYTIEHNGENANQEELVEILKEFLIQNPSLDFYSLFTDHFWNDTTEIYKELAPDIKVGRVIAGIICHEVQQTKGQEGLNQLITCGDGKDRFDNFMDMTEKLLGLNRNNFDEKIRVYLNR